MTEPPALTPPSSWPRGSSPGSCAKKTGFLVPWPSKILAAINANPSAHLFITLYGILKKGPVLNKGGDDQMEDLSLNLVGVEVWVTCCFQSNLHFRVASFNTHNPRLRHEWHIQIIEVPHPAHTPKKLLTSALMGP